jgi:hypothetical protein
MVSDQDPDAEPDMLADTVRRVLDAASGWPADVFGSNGGAVTGPALVACHGGHVQRGRVQRGRIRTHVAHEPPVVLLLTEAEEAHAALHDLYEAYRASGADAAWQQIAASVGTTVRPQGGDTAPCRRDRDGSWKIERRDVHPHWAQTRPVRDSPAVGGADGAAS